MTSRELCERVDAVALGIVTGRVDAVALGIVTGLVGAILLTAGGCCKTCPPPAKPERIVVTVPASQCIAKAPPAVPVLRFVGPEGGCPEAFEACLSAADAASLFAWKRAASGWQRDAWTRCGPPPAKSP